MRISTLPVVFEIVLATSSHRVWHCNPISRHDSHLYAFRGVNEVLGDSSFSSRLSDHEDPAEPFNVSSLNRFRLAD